MGLQLEIPGRGSFELEVLLLDVNGTLSDRGELIEGVAAKLSSLRSTFEICLLSRTRSGHSKRSLAISESRIGGLPARPRSSRR